VDSWFPSEIHVLDNTRRGATLHAADLVSQCELDNYF
jgi:hypothetical protein